MAILYERGGGALVERAPRYPHPMTGETNPYLTAPRQWSHQIVADAVGDMTDWIKIGSGRIFVMVYGATLGSQVDDPAFGDTASDDPNTWIEGLRKPLSPQTIQRDTVIKDPSGDLHGGTSDVALDYKEGFWADSEALEILRTTGSIFAPSQPISAGGWVRLRVVAAGGPLFLHVSEGQRGD